VTAVGVDSYAERITGEARGFRHPRSPLEAAINGLLLGLVGLMALLAVPFGYAIWHRDAGGAEAIATATAGIVSMVPEGLVLLTSLTFVVAAMRMARRGALVQQLNAVESLASVDVLCLDKTGTLTSGELHVVELIPAAGVPEAELARDLGRYAASAQSRNTTLEAIAQAFPADPDQRRRAIRETTILGRVSPEDKRSIVTALRDDGRYVAMVGDGVNDVPALKAAHLAIAQGSGTQMAKAVADLVLVNGDFAALPDMLAEGRQMLRNLQRVARLYITKASFAAFLIVMIGMTSTAYPLLPRHFTLAATLTIGIPSFFLALAPSSGPWRTASFARDVARFAAPAGVMAGVGVVASYLFALETLELGVPVARTVATSVLVIVGLYIVVVLEAAGRSRSRGVALLCSILVGLYVAALAVPWTRTFFELADPSLAIALTSAGGAAIAVLTLYLAGFVPGAAFRLGPGEDPR